MIDVKELEKEKEQKEKDKESNLDNSTIGQEEP